jgi:SWIM zinc finger
VDAILTPIVAHLPAIVTTLTAANPGAACRIARGAALVAAGAVERVYNVFLVTSASTPDRDYAVMRIGALLTCDCPDYRQRGGPCKHGWAVVCFEAAERIDAEQHDPTPGAVIPLPTPAFDADRDRFVLTPQGHAALASPEHTPA